MIQPHTAASLKLNYETLEGIWKKAREGIGGRTNQGAL